MNPDERSSELKKILILPHPGIGRLQLLPCAHSNKPNEQYFMDFFYPRFYLSGYGRPLRHLSSKGYALGYALS